MTTPAPGPAVPDRKPATRDPKDAIVFDDPLTGRSADDTDQGWGERPRGDGGADLARFLEEKPPHHI